MCGSILVSALSFVARCASNLVFLGVACVHCDACVGMRRIVLHVCYSRLWLALGFYLFDFSYLHLHGFFK
jgi:hypothetical protein